MNNPSRITDLEGRSLIWCAGDLAARLALLNLSETCYEEGFDRGSGMLFHAEMYLADRLAYELHPPPFRGAIPMSACLDCDHLICICGPDECEGGRRE
jgi:hypothetical protein